MFACSDFQCPHCELSLEVDSSSSELGYEDGGTTEKINCPFCDKEFKVSVHFEPVYEVSKVEEST